MKALASQKRKPKRRAKVLISLKAYNLLANHASHYGIKLDDFANIALEVGLEDPKLVERAIAKLKRRSSNE